MSRVITAVVQWIVLGAGLVAGATYHALGFLNHDTSYLLVATERWLNGAALYTDIMEINPPLIFYLTAPAVTLAHLVSIDSSAAFVVWIGVATAISLTWCWSLLGRVPALDSSIAYGIVISCLAALIFIPSVSFGQREHLFVILALPYLMQQVFTASGLSISRTESAALGVFAVFGIALKPFFLLPALLMTIVRCRQERSLRPAFDPANIAIALGCIAYVPFVLVFHPEYFSTIVPLGALIYGAIGYGAYTIIQSSIVPLLLVVAVATVEDAPAVFRNSFAIFAAMLAGLLAVYLVQFKGWSYQLLPFESMALIASIVAAVASSQSIRTRPLHFAILAIVPAVLFARATYYGRYDNLYADVFQGKLEEVRADWSGRSVLLLSTDDFAAFPLINKLGTEWAGRYPYQWVIAGAVSSQARAGCANTPASCPRLNEILDYGRRTNVDDFVSQSPDVVLVDVRPLKPYFPRLNFDYIDFLREDPRFEKKWSEYTRLATELNYDIWVRDTDSSAGRPEQ